jgi:S-formylglutathione hydrolase FrmB
MRKGLSIFLIFFSLVVCGVSQQAGVSLALPANVSEAKLDSKLMGRSMPYRVILPVGYAKAAAKRFPVVYLLHGLTGHYANWTTLGTLAQSAESFGFILITPEGDNGWYNDSPTIANAKYERYIVKELIPEIDAKYRTVNDRKGRAIAGLSMGGYGALKFGLKYPQMFSLVGSFSGAIFAPMFTSQSFSVFGQSFSVPFLEIITRTTTDAFGPPGSASRTENDIFAIVRSIDSERSRSLPFIYFDCGTEDILLQSNRDFATLLLEKKIPHEFRQLPGGHTWPYWNKQVVEFLNLSERILK